MQWSDSRQYGRNTRNAILRCCSGLWRLLRSRLRRYLRRSRFPSGPQWWTSRRTIRSGWWVTGAGRRSQRGSPAGSRPGRWRSEEPTPEAATDQPCWWPSTIARSGRKVTEEVAARLKKKVGLQRERFVVCSTHTHCGPALSSELDFIFGSPIPPDQKARIDRYTRELTDAIEKVALAALAARAPATLAWGQGRLGFAANRRVLKDGRWVNFGVNPNGPVDHSLPVLRATDAAGKVRAVLFGYACHCTTLGGEFNKICAEWAGYACDEIEKQSPGAIALAIIGCGADANPEPRRGLDDAKTHGSAAAARSTAWSRPRSPRCPAGSTPGFASSSCRWNRSPAAQARGTDQASRIRGVPGPELDRTARPRRVAPDQRALLVQTWCFGDEMAMVFLAGEVVVDYALRLKWEIDPDRLWIAAYSNDVPCYIPSRRILSEGDTRPISPWSSTATPRDSLPQPRTSSSRRSTTSCPRRSTGRGNRRTDCRSHRRLHGLRTLIS